MKKNRNDFEEALNRIGWKIKKSGNGLNDHLISPTGKITKFRVTDTCIEPYSNDIYGGESNNCMLYFNFDTMHLLNDGTVCLGSAGSSLMFMNHDTKIKIPKVFLGGTCAGSKWRERLIPLLKINYFNPVVDNWTLECQENEIKMRKECEFSLYSITPKMKGFYSIAEAVKDAFLKKEKCVFIYTNDFDEKGSEICFSEDKEESLKAIARMIETEGGKVFNNFNEVADYLNSFLNEKSVI